MWPSDINRETVPLVLMTDKPVCLLRDPCLEHCPDHGVLILE
jgi:hypothetical protein